MQSHDYNQGEGMGQHLTAQQRHERNVGHLAPSNSQQPPAYQKELPLVSGRYTFVDGNRLSNRLSLLLSSPSTKHWGDIVRPLSEAKAAATPEWRTIRQSLQTLSRQAPNCSEFLDLVLAQIHLHQYTRQRSPLRLLPTLLVGPPGVGKTFIVERLGLALTMPTERIALTNATEAFVLSGCPQGYGTSTPGEVANKLAQCPVINPIIILDELDKAAFARSDRATVEGPLLSLLEPETATRFEDACLRLPMNASHITWVATANSTAMIPEPLLSRFQVIQISGLSDSDRLIFLESTAQQIQFRYGLEDRQWRFDASAAERLISLSVRVMRNTLSLLLARQLLSKPDAREWTTTEHDLTGILPPRARSCSIGFT